MNKAKVICKKISRIRKQLIEPEVKVLLLESRSPTQTKPNAINANEKKLIKTQNLELGMKLMTPRTLQATAAFSILECNTENTEECNATLHCLNHTVALGRKILKDE